MIEFCRTLRGNFIFFFAEIRDLLLLTFFSLFELLAQVAVAIAVQGGIIAVYAELPGYIGLIDRVVHEDAYIHQRLADDQYHEDRCDKLFHYAGKLTSYHLTLQEKDMRREI